MWISSRVLFTPSIKFVTTRGSLPYSGRILISGGSALIYGQWEITRGRRGRSRSHFTNNHKISFARINFDAIQSDIMSIAPCRFQIEHQLLATRYFRNGKTKWTTVFSEREEFRLLCHSLLFVVLGIVSRRLAEVFFELLVLKTANECNRVNSTVVHQVLSNMPRCRRPNRSIWVIDFSNQSVCGVCRSNWKRWLKEPKSNEENYPARLDREKDFVDWKHWNSEANVVHRIRNRYAFL